jgi:hypothetical protein
MLAVRIMQHIPERANQLSTSRNHLTLGAHHEGEESWTTDRGADGRQRCLAIEPQARPRPTHPAGDVLRQNTMIFTIVCVVGLVVSVVATAHAIWVRGI